MELHIRGRAYCFGDDIDTDQIYPGNYLEITDPEKIAEHCLEGADPNFVKEFEEGGIILAGSNFGCGSSREHAAIAIKGSGVKAIVAKSFARIFYRNAINLGLVAIQCKGLDSIQGCPDNLSIDFRSSTITFEQGQKVITLPFEPFSDYAMEILSSGGIKPLLMSKLSKPNQ